MTRRHLRNAVILKRGSMELGQRAAATKWGIAYGTYVAVEEDTDAPRDFGAGVLHKLTVALGQSALELLQEEPDAKQADVDALTRRVDLLETEIADLRTQRDPRYTALEALVQDMAEGDFALALSIFLAAVAGRRT